MSFLLKTVDEVREGNGEVNEVEAALEAVKSKKEELRKEINGRLYPALKRLRRERKALWKRSGEIVGERDECLFHLEESHDMETCPAVEDFLQ